MTPNKRHAREWFERAINDLQYAEAGETETQIHHITCFLCQQAVEKGLKGLLVATGKTPEKTHHLGRLASLIIAHYPTLQQHLTELRKLDKYYITARYPDDLRTDFSAEDAKEALEITNKVIGEIGHLLK